MPSVTRPDAVARWLWAVPGAIALHNLEEALTIRTSLAHADLPGRWRHAIDGGGLTLFYVAIAAMAIVVAAIAAFGNLRDPRSRSARALLVIQVLMAVNAFWHIGAAVYLGRYAPGVATAVLVNLPLSYFLLSLCWRERWLSHRAMLVTAAIVAAVHSLPLLLLLAPGG
jgi:hypothetical protein